MCRWYYNSKRHQEKLNQLSRQTATDNFYNDWLDNYITEDDIIYIAESGLIASGTTSYNLFTLPIEEEPVEEAIPGSLKVSN